MHNICFAKQRDKIFQRDKMCGSQCVCVGYCRPWGAPPGGSSGPEHHLTAGDPSVHRPGACEQHSPAQGRACAHKHISFQTAPTSNIKSRSSLLSYSSSCSCALLPGWCRARLWWAAPSLWPGSRLRAVPCMPAARCVPEPEGWAVCGAARRKPAGSVWSSKYCKCCDYCYYGIVINFCIFLIIT